MAKSRMRDIKKSGSSKAYKDHSDFKGGGTPKNNFISDMKGGSGKSKGMSRGY
jgi:hypothetical protein